MKQICSPFAILHVKLEILHVKLETQNDPRLQLYLKLFEVIICIRQFSYPLPTRLMIRLAQLIILEVLFIFPEENRTFQEAPQCLCHGGRIQQLRRSLGCTKNCLIVLFPSMG